MLFHKIYTSLSTTEFFGVVKPPLVMKFFAQGESSYFTKNKPTMLDNTIITTLRLNLTANSFLPFTKL